MAERTAVALYARISRDPGGDMLGVTRLLEAVPPVIGHPTEPTAPAGVADDRTPDTETHSRTSPTGQNEHEWLARWGVSRLAPDGPCVSKGRRQLPMGDFRLFVRNATAPPVEAGTSDPGIR